MGQYMLRTILMVSFMSFAFERGSECIFCLRYSDYACWVWLHFTFLFHFLLTFFWISLFPFYLSRQVRNFASFFY